MFPKALIEALKETNKAYAVSRSLKHKCSKGGVVLFDDVRDNLHPESYARIEANEAWRIRLLKKHTKVSGTVELASSNSSDALLMSIFCHPKMREWKGPRKLIGVDSFEDLTFGYHPEFPNEAYRRGTEIDLKIGDRVYIESKLTERDFTAKDKKIVMGYSEFSKVFVTEILPKTDTKYENYQLIRNILAIWKQSTSTRFVLLCDGRRPDLLRRFAQTVCAIRDAGLRARCSVFFWQELAGCVGDDLKEFLAAKYGL